MGSEGSTEGWCAQVFNALFVHEWQHPLDAEAFLANSETTCDETSPDGSIVESSMRKVSTHRVRNECMSELDAVSVAELRAALDEVSDKTPAMRLVAAIAHKHGVTQTELSEWLGVERKTIYNWFQRIDRETDLVDAVTDDPRPGRPRKLSPEDETALKADLTGTPTDYGFDVKEWTPTILQQHLQATYGVEYSLPSCRRLLDEYGP